MIVHANSEFVKQLVEAIGIEDWRRIIINITQDSIATIYIEQFADEEKLALVNLDSDMFITPNKAVIRYNAKEVENLEDVFNNSFPSSGEISFDIKIDEGK